MSTRLLILICSCLCRRRDLFSPPDPLSPARMRQACRETWLRRRGEDMRYAFLVGVDEAGRCVAPAGEEDVWALPAPDSYQALPEKILAAFQRALSLPDWDFLFKCDDDTYCDLGRLRGLLRAQDGSPTLTSWAGRLASGGAGYLLPRALVEAVAQDPLYNKQGKAHEDKQVTWSVLRAGGRQARDVRLQHYMCLTPAPDNNLISCHTCSPQDLRRIEALLHPEEQGGRGSARALALLRLPQGRCLLPPAGGGGRGDAARGDAQGCARAGGRAVARPRAWMPLVAVPSDVVRVVVLSNVTQGFAPEQIPLREGDLVLHCNRARHRAAAMATPGARHWLFVRHGRGRDPLGWHWYHPDCFDGFERVIFLDDGAFLRPMLWYREFRRTTDKSPTTGFLVANTMRELCPNVPLLLAGFDPARSHGTPRWDGHDWQAEAEWYQEKNFCLLRPLSPSL